jgi:hypothetical protein
MASLGSLMNGFTNYNSYVPGMKYPGIDDFLKRYAARAKEAKQRRGNPAPFCYTEQKQGHTTFNCNPPLAYLPNELACHLDRGAAETTRH